MSPDELDHRLSAVEGELAAAAHLLHRLSETLIEPIFYQSAGSHRGFRYARPDARHFCLLKGVRAVSGMCACIQLARGGFTQEIAVIIRTVVECTSHIEYVLLETDRSGVVAPGPQAVYVRKFFQDFRRDVAAESVRPRVQQKDVHRAIGSWLDQHSRQLGKGLAGSPTAELMWRVYEVNSNYVHARYPEVMDLYGGRPARFHLHGMLGTPKDVENCEMIKSYSTTVSQCVTKIGRTFELETLPD